MPRALSEYGLADWLRLRVLTHCWKSGVSNLRDRLYSRTAPPDPEALERLRRQLSGRNLVVTIAWNTPWVIGWHLKFVAAHLRGARLVVADNSTEPEARADIARLCRDAGVPYVALPASPYTDTRHASRSHGMALNWAYRNIVLPLRPAVFGFLDHDLMPLAPLDVERLTAAQPFFGRVIVRGDRWYLWPGYCFFRLAAAAGRRLDFRQDWFVGLDTGGMNWSVYYREFDYNRMAVPVCSTGTGPGEADTFEWIDQCFHVTNASAWNPTDPGRRARMEALLAELWSGSRPIAVPGERARSAGQAAVSA